MEYNLIKYADDIDEAWLYWYDLLAKQNHEMHSRDGDVVGEILNAVTVIHDPTRNIMKNDVRKLSMRYAVGELLWYLSGNKNLSEIRKYTKAWDRMSDDGMTVNSNYGWCIQTKYGFDQWDYIKDLLIKYPNTRQAIIHIKEADCSDRYSKDVNCTCYLQFFIREGELHMTANMRSNDIWMGFPYDVFQFTCMQILMSMQLGIPIGTYTHVVGSLHLYKRDLKERSNNE